MSDRDCTALLQWALPHLNHRWEGYRRVRRQVCKRLAARIDALGLADMPAYCRRLEEDPAEWTALCATLRVTVSHFFRNRGMFHALAQSILPALAELALKKDEKTFRVWSAGCASGEEPYSVSLLWSFDLRTRFPALDLSILATDIDADVLRRDDGIWLVAPLLNSQLIKRGENHLAGLPHRNRWVRLDWSEIEETMDLWPRAEVADRMSTSLNRIDLQILGN